jgi:hypothetical protein
MPKTLHSKTFTRLRQTDPRLDDEAALNLTFTLVDQGLVTLSPTGDVVVKSEHADRVARLAPMLVDVAALPSATDEQKLKRAQIIERQASARAGNAPRFGDPARAEAARAKLRALPALPANASPATKVRRALEIEKLAREIEENGGPEAA